MPSPSPDERARSPGPRGDSLPRHRSRSKSPRRDDQDSRSPKRRSQSPPRGPKAKNFSGLKWKKHDKRDDDGDDRRGGYRERDEDRRRDDRYSGRRGGDERDRGYDRRDRDRDRFDSDRRDRRGEDRYRDDRRRGEDRNQYDRRRGDERNRDDRRREDGDRERKPKAEKPKPAAAPAVPGEQMIIVTVNDRLGTKAQIPCLPSDPVKVFRAMVAARIGRAPHEIRLQKQGMRPLKDQLTLADYEISNGVQLDLELATGD